MVGVSPGGSGSLLTSTGAIRLAVRSTRYPLLDARYWLGRIERWTGEGTVLPFAIGRLDRAQLEKPGTVMEAFVVE